MEQFHDTPIFENTLGTPSLQKNVKTLLVCKFDSTVKTTLAYHRINSGKLLPRLLACEHVPDDVKIKLCKLSGAKCSVEWMKEFSLKRKVAESSGDVALEVGEAAVEESQDPSAGKRRQRQQLLDGRTVDKISKAEAMAINFFLYTFFLACRIPFFIVDNYFFRQFIGALRPAYLEVMPHRTALGTTGVDEVYEETLATTAAHLDRVPGRRTLSLDGKTDIRGRGTVNVCEGKQAITAYVTTRYVGAREHTCQMHANLAQEYLGDGREFVAVVADNTGNMRKMFNILRILYPFIFFLGCAIHVLDLLVEDIAKLDEMAEIVADWHFVTSFLKRHSLLYEAFLKRQSKARHARGRLGDGPVTLKLFPLTRFAYCYLMIHGGLRSWALLRDVPDYSEYAVVKAKALKTRRNNRDEAADFEKFEDLVGHQRTKKKGEAACSLLMPITKILHYLEGDSVCGSHLLPLYTLWNTFIHNLPLSFTTQLRRSTIAEVQECTKHRWLGGPSKVGLRHDFHCLVFSLDPYVRAAVVAVCGMDELARMDRTFTEDNVHAALKNYNGGKVDSKLSRLISEFSKYKSRTGIYKSKLSAVDLVVKMQIPEKILPLLSDEDKSTKLLTMLAVLQRLHMIGGPVTFFNSLDAVSADSVEFAHIYVSGRGAGPFPCM
ncbi:hypothetical protein CYMTET_14685 [Cymbomonas tetramitiformis]|uniref:DUF659 domain-containing protein n=1 Tax=Cymbomonas tetramitiformis TaxID=36881 RepID=A0AAE0GFV5_9CHLO|nr:hypothetical protein CYMTET_14685 [Cymbomonas tetramitiformis]